MIVGPGAIERVAAVVAGGGVAVVPTDTVYGLACDPRDLEAIERIYAIKGRPGELELNLLLGEVSEVERVAILDAVARGLAERFWPGALALVVPVRREAGLCIPRRGDTIMVRVPGHPLLRDLLRSTGPVASTSANRHGQPPAASAAEAESTLGSDVDIVLDGGPAAGRPSTIIDCTSMPPRVLRAGLLDPEQLRPYLGG